MLLDKHIVADILRANDVKHLYHANTVGTASTFLRTGQLLSRGTVQDRKLHQTSQPSDESDQFLGLWYDIFFDACDVHSLASKRNSYGPVLLKFDLALLENEAIEGIWVAKKNPLYWVKKVNNNWVSKVAEGDRWFQSTDELNSLYKRTNFDYHIVLRFMHDGLPMLPYLREVILDNPNRMHNYQENHVPWMALALGSILSSYRAGGFRGSAAGVNIRNCHCRCEDEYQAMGTDLIKKFFAL